MRATLTNTLLKGEKVAADVTTTMTTSKGADLKIQGEDDMTKSNPTRATC